MSASHLAHSVYTGKKQNRAEATVQFRGAPEPDTGGFFFFFLRCVTFSRSKGEKKKESGRLNLLNNLRGRVERAPTGYADWRAN